MAVERAVFTSRKNCACRDLFLRVLKLTKGPHMKYGKGMNKGAFKVRRQCSTATVKVRLHSMIAQSVL